MPTIVECDGTYTNHVHKGNNICALMKKKIKPSDFVVSHNRTFDTAVEPSDLGLLHNRVLAQSIGFWRDHRTREIHRTLERKASFI